MDVRWDQKVHLNFFYSILNGMVDMVRVVDADNNIVLMNKKMIEVMGDMTGQKCYSVFCADGPCDECISLCAIRRKHSFSKLETLNGRIYSVLSSPVLNEEGEVVAAVEVFRDITEERQLREQIMKHNNQMLQDLNFARKIQYSFLPNRMPNAHPYRFFALYKPCEMVSGDMYDVFWVDENHIAFYIADVAGHGVTAAMLTVFLKEAMLYRAKEVNRIYTPSQMLEELCKRFRQVDLEDHFYITLFYGLINVKTGQFQYSNAGHSVPPILVGSERMKGLELPGLPICKWFEDVSYEDGQEELLPGDKLLLYTDGLVEMDRALLDEGSQKITEAVTQFRNSSGNEFLSGVFTAMSGNTEYIPKKDDITMLLIERL